MADHTVDIEVDNNGNPGIPNSDDYSLHVNRGHRVKWRCKYPFTIHFLGIAPFAFLQIRVPGQGKKEDPPYETDWNVILDTAELRSYPYHALPAWRNLDNNEEVRVLNQPDIIVD